MAWNVNIIKDGSSYTTENYSSPVPLTWGTFSVFIFRFQSSVDYVSFDLSTNSLGGSGQAYICSSPSDFMNSEETPDNYIATFSMNTGYDLYLDDFPGTSVFIVVRPRSSTSGGFCNLNARIGGAPTTAPYFTAENYGSDGIRVNIFDPSYLITDQRCRVSVDGVVELPLIILYETTTWTSTGFTDGTHRVTVEYMADGSYYDLENNTGGYYIDIVIGGGPSPSESWHYTQYAAQTNITTSGRTLAYNITSSGGVNEGVYCMLVFSSSGTATVSLSRSDMTVYIVPGGDYGYNSQNGAPFDYYGDEVSGGTSRTFSATAGDYYYLWVRGDSSSATGVVTVTVSLGNVQWNYDDGYGDRAAISSEITQQVTIQPYTGALFRASFTRSGTASFATSGTSAYVYVTTGNYGYDTQTGVPFANGGGEAPGGTSITFAVSSGSYYYVWVKGTTSSVSGNFTVTITPQSTPTGWEEVYVGDVNVTTTDRSFNRPCDMMKVYRYNVRYSTGGTVRIYSSGATSSSDVIAYWGTSNNGINTSTGVPIDKDYTWDDDGSDRNFNSGDITVAANTNYYLWVRCYRDDTTAQITIYFTAPASNAGKVWIYISSGWTQAVPWVYTSSGWKQAVPWIYTANGWKQTT